MPVLYRYLKLGTTGKSVPGVKTKVAPSSDDAHIKTPRLENGATSENVGEVNPAYLVVKPVLCSILC